MKIRLGLVAACLLLVAGLAVQAQAPAANPEEEFIKTHYAKYEYRIPMRDGAKLFVAVYTPDPGAFKDHGPYPFLMTRTPYSCGPYGEDKLPTRLAPAIPAAPVRKLRRLSMEAPLHVTVKTVRFRMMCWADAISDGRREQGRRRSRPQAGAWGTQRFS